MAPTLTTSCCAVEEGIPELRDSSVACAVCSPPYFLRDGASPGLMVATGRLLARVLEPGARAFVVVGQVKEDVGAALDWASQIAFGGAPNGLQHAQTIVWVKSIAVGGWRDSAGVTEPTVCRGHVTPINSERILNYGHEYIFQFTKGPPEKARPYDRLSVGVEYADKGNLGRETRGKNGDVRCRGDAWFVPYSTTGKADKKRHPHAFPAELARMILKLARVPEGGLVLDPFTGGGTVPLVARELGLNAWANDRSAEWVAATKASWEELDGRLRRGEEGAVREVRPMAAAVANVTFGPTTPRTCDDGGCRPGCPHVAPNGDRGIQKS